MINMAVTLAQAKLNVTDDLERNVIDEFRKSSYLLNAITFHDCVSPVGGGATPTYGYTRLVTQPTAAFRNINSEYAPSEVEKQRYTVDLKVFGGSFEIDRILAGFGGIVDEVQLQLQQKIKAASTLFCDKVINGDSAAIANEFDGLDVAVTGTDTEFNAAGNAIDLSSAAQIEANAGTFLLLLNKSLKKLDGTPSFIAGNSDLISALEYLARYTGRYQQTQDEWGNYVSTYNGIPLIDFGNKAGSNDPIISTDGEGKTSLYMARLGLDGFHAISMAGQPPVRTWLPDFTTAGAVKKGEVEMVAACVLKKSKAAGVIRNLKIS